MARKLVRDPNGLKPLKKIDWKHVDRLLQCGCSGMQVAANIGIGSTTLYERCQQEKGMHFSEYAQEKRATGESLLLEAQFSKAVDLKDSQMLLWLGKVILKQTDQIVQTKPATADSVETIATFISKEADKIRNESIPTEPILPETDSLL